MAQVAPSDFILLKKLNYGFQNDFGFAIVSVDDLDSAENSKKSLEAVEFFIQVSVPLRNLHKVMKGATSFSRCWR